MSRKKNEAMITKAITTVGAIGLGYLCIRGMRKTRAEKFSKIYTDGIVKYLQKKVEKGEITKDEYSEVANEISVKMVTEEKELQASGYERIVDETVLRVQTVKQFEYLNKKLDKQEITEDDLDKILKLLEESQSKEPYIKKIDGIITKVKKDKKKKQGN